MPSGQKQELNLGRSTEDRIDDVEIELASIAAKQLALTESIAAVTKTVGDLGRNVQSAFERSESRMESLRGLIQDQGKPKWSIMATMFGVIVVVVGWYAKSEIAPLDTRMQAFDKQLDATHGVSERLARLEVRAELQDVGLRITPSDRDELAEHRAARRMRQ